MQSIQYALLMLIMALSPLLGMIGLAILGSF
jgi:hypothetical protein